MNLVILQILMIYSTPRPQRNMALQQCGVYPEDPLLATIQQQEVGSAHGGQASCFVWELQQYVLCLGI